MIVISFGRWSSASGIWFTRERIYRGGRWTPFCRISWRYKNKLMGFWGR
jgi:hypothetical protein